MGHALTRSDEIKNYSPYDVTSSRPRKTTNAFFVNFGGIEKLFCTLDQSLNFESCDSMQHRRQFSGIKKGAKISFHRHFNETVRNRSFFSNLVYRDM